MTPIHEHRAVLIVYVGLFLLAITIAWVQSG